MSRDVAEFLDHQDATAVAEAIRSGDLDAREVLDVSLARVEERNPSLNAIVAHCADQAHADVDNLDREAPFAGVPFVIKDLGASVAGLPQTHGSRLWADNIAATDSELVRRYRRAGFIIIGVTNSPELGKSASTEPALHGPTRNPHRPTHSPGGSSGGTAAAVAAGIVPIGHGSDGGGSIRIPSAMCGLVGLKPSRGRTTAAPEFSLLSYPLGVAHVLSRSVRDTARALDATAGPVPGDAYVIDRSVTTYESATQAPPGRLRVAVSTRDRRGEPFHPDCAASVRAMADLLADLGHEVVEAEPAYPNDAFATVMKTMSGVTTKMAVDDRLAELGRPLRDDDLEPFTRMMYDRAGSESGEDVLRAYNEIERAAREVGEFFVGFDLVLTATLAQPTPELGYLDTTDVQAMVERAGAFSVLTAPFNVTGQPAISLPTGSDASGLPIGVQLVGAFGREDLLVSIAAQVEARQPWPIAPVWNPAL